MTDKNNFVARTKRLARGLGALIVVFVVVLLNAQAVSAHVHVSPVTASAGSTVDLTFEVPSEEPAASTVKIQVFFGDDNPVLQANPANAPGWSSTVEKDGSAVSSVTWEGGSIAPEASQDFGLTIRVPDKADILVMSTEQTYSSGKVVKWDDPPVGAEAERDHPAPAIRVLGVTTTTVDPSSTTTTSVATTTTTLGANSSKSSDKSDSPWGLMFLAFGVFVLILVTIRAWILSARQRKEQ